MANEQHIEWLLEGVEAWNARRAREDFVPDFSHTSDLFARFEAEGLVRDERRMDLRAADLSGASFKGANIQSADLYAANLIGADLEAADLTGSNIGRADLSAANLVEAVLGAVNLHQAELRSADLRRANIGPSNLSDADLSNARLGEAKLGAAVLRRANLEEADLRKADLTEADLRMAYLLAADLGDAELTGADIRSLHSEFDMSDGGTPLCTDLGGVYGLTQAQLETMRGDRGVILPDELTYPDHWPEPQPSGETEAPKKDEWASQGSEQPRPVADAPLPLAHFRAHVRFLTTLGPVAREAAAQTAAQIEWAIAEYRKDAGHPNQMPEELEAYHRMGAYLLDISRLLSEVDASQAAVAERDTQIEILEARVADLTVQITTLNTALANTKDTAVKQVLVASLGAAGGAVMTGLALTGGSHVADGLRTLHDIIQSWGMSAPPPSHSLG